MTSLLPSLQAADLRAALTNYLATTFALTDDDVRIGLQGFLTDPDQGIFRGPYVRLRLPFRPAAGTWAVPLDWHPEGFTPYGHQAKAFERLSSKHHEPLPTLVTTGTGSGKTESFLVPILDHVLRARQDGQRGIKALVLYPMNALANDQAQRLATMITTDARLSDVTAGLYTGEHGTQRTTVSEAGLITDRAVLQSDPPDILLTNYKMLDQLLLRPADANLWRASRDSLRYLVLDEFHTYDGAQGTDVAMLLRRLGLTLGIAQSGRPLGAITPVATSATLGTGDSAAMREFAATVFGLDFGDDAIVREDRLTADQWFAERARHDQRPVVHQPRELYDPAELARQTRTARTPLDAVTALVQGLVVQKPRHGEYVNELSTPEAARLVDDLESGGDLGWLISQHPLTRALVELAAAPVSLGELAAQIFPDDLSPEHEDSQLVLGTYLGLLSLARVRLADELGRRRLLSTDIQLWIREVSRVERVADTAARFRWTDDGVDTSGELYLPAIYCRHCGRSGWSVLAAPTGRSVEVDATKIRAEAMRDGNRTRALIYAGGEAAASEEHNTVEGLHWFDTVNRELLTSKPDLDELPVDDAPVLPVLVNRHDEDNRARRDTCPACERPDGIRFLGTGIATLASVSMSSIFAAEHLDRDEKKTLMFTDSVQDAAHRAGFVQARSHVLTLRGALRRALAEQELTLTELAAAALEQAGDDPFRRYVLVPPSLADQAGYEAFFEPGAPRAAERAARGRVSRRLAFDIALEFGLSSRTGRTLELTGCVAAEVSLGTPDRISRIGAAALERARQHGLSPELDGSWASDAAADLRAWVRGVAERIRTQGGISHYWLNEYLADDGSRWEIWGGRDRRGGMPAFPSGRSAPAFPTSARSSELLNAIGSSQSWYARWAQRCLDVSARDGSALTRALLDTLVDERVLLAIVSRGGNRIWSLPPEHVIVMPAQAVDEQLGPARLRCNVCHTAVPGTPAVIEDLHNAACLRIGCPGRLQADVFEADYYRDLYASSQTRRVVAAEHTSLLPDDIRLAREEAFKRGQKPADPNVLVATPTLELGIDIGDLSTVMLSSLPRSVAAYQQRIGRAGRRTGNALVLAYVPGRGNNLPRWADPLSVIDGDVRPPATYLDAVEILQRQYVAYLIDRGAADPDASHTNLPRHSRSVLETWEPGSWTGDLLAGARAGAAVFVEGFLDQFGSRVRSDTADDLRRWAGVGAVVDEVTGLERLLHRAVQSWRAEVDELTDRILRAREALSELEQKIAQPAATDEDQILYRTTKAELAAIRRRSAELKSQHWIAALEERGVLPNYTLLDDMVTLDVAVRWFDQDTGEYQDEPRTYQRTSRGALTEFAPGSTFYAQGVAARIDAVDLRNGGTDRVEEWVLCARCGWGDAGSTRPSQCPRCGDESVQDTGQRLQVLPLERVSAQVSRDDAAISDATDDRDRQQYNVVTAADVDPADITSAWHLEDFPFGAEYIRGIDIRWLNLGRARVSGRDRLIAGFEMQTPLFRACPGCGIVPAAQRRDEQSARHRGWCAVRNDLDIEWREIALGRSLRTQAVRLLVPPQYTTDLFAAVSFRAALLIGLRAVIGGDPDHLDIVDVHAPVNGVDRVALLLHDIVPGGTGYLADFARPDRVKDLLEAALEVVQNCECATQGKLACHRCLLPFVAPSQVDRASRARAAQMLGEILGTVAVGGNDAPHVWRPVAAASIADVAQPSPESHLEQRFRDVLAGALRARGATVTERPLPEGTLVEFALPGSTSRRWTLRPQVSKGGAKPDFVLTTQDTAIPEICIFTDGAAYHASAAHNRVRDDASKRRALRELGCAVWSISSADIDRFERMNAGQPVPSLGPLSAEALQVVRGQLLPGSASCDLLASDGVSQLLAWIAKPDNAGWQKLAARVALGFGVLPGAQRGRGNPGESFGRAAAALDSLATPDAGGRGVAAWTWAQTGLAVVAIATSANPLTLEVAMIVDDRTNHLVSDDGVDGWRDWLRLGNVLGFSEYAMTIGTLSEVTGGVLDPGTPVDHQPEPAGLSPEWQALHDAALSDAERTLVVELAAAGLPVPVQGYETAEGTPMDLAWPTLRVAVTTDAVNIDAGWTVIRFNADSVIEKIKSALAAGAGV